MRFRVRPGPFFGVLGRALARVGTLSLGLAPFALIAFGSWRLWGLGWSAIAAGLMMWVDWHLPTPSTAQEDKP